MSQSYSLTFEHRLHYLFVIVEGKEGTVAVSLAYWAEIAAACRRNHVSRLLVHETLKANAKNIDDAALVIAELPGMFGEIRIAFVDLNETFDVLVPSETEARKVGLVHVFGSLEAAERWLLSDVEHRTAA